jgi:predicted Co/Zn/Cd cation transporter (cation efflux family)
MLRAALALLSTLQVGARIRKSFERSLRQAVVIAVAVALLIAAAIFGLVAAYHALVSVYQFDAVQAATIMAAGLMLVGLIVLAIVPLIGRQPKRAHPSPFVSADEGPNLVDQGLGKAMQQIGPVPLIAIAFIAGILAGRR